MKTKSLQHLQQLVCFLLLLCSFSIFFVTETKATETYINNNEMQIKGTFHYIRTSSSSYRPIDNLDNEIHIIYLSAEAERKIVIDPYLSNESQTTIEGYLDTNMACSIPFGGRLEVIQDCTNGNSTKKLTVYYDVDVIDCNTNVLYRAERNNTYITLISIALIIFAAITIIRSVSDR